MDKSESQQGERFVTASEEGPNSGTGDAGESDRGPTESISDGFNNTSGVKAKWIHGQNLAPNPDLKKFLLSLRSGLESMLEAEKNKLEEYVKAKNRMGGS